MFVIVMVGALWLGHFTFVLLFGFILAASLLEFYLLADKMDVTTQKWPGILLGLLTFALTFLHAGNWIEFKWVMILLISLVVVPLIEMAVKRKNPFQNIAYTLLGLGYIALPLSCSNYLVFTDHSNQYSFQVLLPVFILIWTYDTFAYLTGLIIGKHKLIERISPKKTWEGFFGGLLWSMIISWIIFKLTGTHTLQDWITISLIVSITATVGDLTESALKRATQSKDSGKLMPGHGGILDRFDGALFAIPSVFVYLQLFVF